MADTTRFSLATLIKDGGWQRNEPMRLVLSASWFDSPDESDIIA